MLCEGIFLFIFLNYVFYSGIMTKWYMYFGIGWGKLSMDMYTTDIVYMTSSLFFIEAMIL